MGSSAPSACALKLNTLGMVVAIVYVLFLIFERDFSPAGRAYLRWSGTRGRLPSRDLGLSRSSSERLSALPVQYRGRPGCLADSAE